MPWRVRRTNTSAFEVALRQRALVSALGGLDRDAVIAALEPFITDARRARLKGVFASRIGSVRVLCDRLYDPHNGAAVLRSCEAFGVGVMHAVERPTQRFVASRAVSRGAERWVEVRTASTPAEAAGQLEADGFELVATHPAGTLEPSDLARIPKLCLVMGNERDGIGPELTARCARSVRIPMRGFVESLNLSVTNAILLSHATAGRAGDLPDNEQRDLYARALVLSLSHAPEYLAAAGIHTPGLGDAAFGFRAEP